MNPAGLAGGGADENPVGPIGGGVIAGNRVVCRWSSGVTDGRDRRSTSRSESSRVRSNLGSLMAHRSHCGLAYARRIVCGSPFCSGNKHSVRQPRAFARVFAGGKDARPQGLVDAQPDALDLVGHVKLIEHLSQ